MVWEQLREEPGKDQLYNSSTMQYNALKYASSYLRDDQGLKWFAEYGCVLVTQKTSNHVHHRVALNLLGLDSSRFEMHCHERSGPHSNNGKVQTFEILHVGTVLSNDLPDFHAKFERILCHASSRTKDKRSASSGKQGHQRTPAFIHACQRQAMLCKCLSGEQCRCQEQLPKGGFMDVGLHTGGRGTDTSWALAQKLEKEIIEIASTGKSDYSQLYDYLDTAQCILSSAAIKTAR
eukprot:4143385-Ditylum_brightwellii.AAC.1